MPTANHFCGKAHLGEAAFADPGKVAYSLAYFCPRCGDIWYRIVVTYDDGAPAAWDVAQVPCLSHTPGGVQDWSRIPGTITDAFLNQHLLSRMWWARALENLPPAALKREFLQLLNHYERPSHDHT